MKGARVLVVGAGGLGSPALLYLAAAGVGTLGIADGDNVDLSNLQRQVLFGFDDIGHNKAEAAVRKLERLNPNLVYIPYSYNITAALAPDIVHDYHVVVDCTDNFATRYLLNDVCVLMKKPLVYASILRFEGQVAVLNAPLPDGTFSPNYRDLFPEPPAPDEVPNCAEAGVMGAMAGMIGSAQANEVVKLITGAGTTLAGRLLIVDGLTMETYTVKIPDREARASIKGLVDYDEFCGINRDKNKSLNTNTLTTMKEVTVQELKAMRDAGADFQLIDVREPHEFDICNLGGELIPQGEIPAQVDRISRDKQVVIHCRSGARSGNMVQWLEKNHGFTNLYNLKGGILAWGREIDPSMPQY